jgi:adenine-specific DNA-methyltransferase
MTADTNANNPIPKITRDDEAAGSGDLARENVDRLKALFPQIVTDGKVDFDVLRQLLGDEVEDGEERYGLNWKGKRRARAFAMTPSLGTLRPAPEDSVDWDTTQNLMIEGDNLEVLKLLRRSYAGKVKLIYIDPPYNTGNDFVYPDNFVDSMGNYMAVTGQHSAAGTILTSNREAAGRFHSDWLSMMYPRLMLATELLRDDGFIVISIDDNEVASLRKLLDEILGEENFVANVVWRRTVSLAVSGEGVAVAHDHIIVYSRTRAATVNRLLVADEDSYSNPDNDPRGPYKKQKLERTLEGARPTMTFAIETPVGPITKTWSVNPTKFQELLADNRIVFSGSGLPYYKQFLSEYGGRLPDSWWGEQGGFNQNASRELTALMGEKGVFNNPNKLATSNLKPWQPDSDNLEASILDAVDNVLPDRTEHDLLVELLLKTGIDLTMPEERRTIVGQTVHALGGGALMVCLGNIGPDDAETLGQGMADWLDELDPTQTTIYFKDVGLGTDNNRSATKANLAAILRQRHGDRIAKIASI